MAGVPKKIVQGEENMNQIWPKDEGLRQNINERNRSLITGDVNRSNFNARLMKLKNADGERIQEFLL